MQLLHQRTVSSAKDFTKYSQPDLDVNEKMSEASCRMNPVASGDNMSVLGSAHKLELPLLIPCCEGRELKIDEELVRTGLSAISVKHDNISHSLSLSSACERMQVAPGLVKHRNSFRNLLRPDLKRVPYLRRMSPDELQTIFKGYADLPNKTGKNDNQAKTAEIELPLNQDEGTLHPMAETCSDIPEGMRLRSARARLYTSVLAAAKTGDQLDGISINEELDAHVPVDPVPEDEDLAEELQVILPPKCEEDGNEGRSQD